MTELVQWPVGASIPRRLMTGLKALNVLQYEPDHPVHGPVFEWCLDIEAHQRRAKRYRSAAASAEIMVERPSLQGPDLDLSLLERLPDGSLGREFARYFERNGIKPFVSNFAIDSDDVYLAKRYRETHDLLHVITGYPTHFLGEMELQAFVLGNMKLPSAAMILVFSLFVRFRACGLRQFDRYVRRVRAAYRRGAKSKDLLEVKFECLWETPVSEVSSQLVAPEESVPEITEGIHQPHKQPA